MAAAALQQSIFIFIIITKNRRQGRNTGKRDKKTDEHKNIKKTHYTL